MRIGLFLSLLLVAGCSKPIADCVHSVDEFRSALRIDPTLAKAPDEAIELARAHRDEPTSECKLANGFADDAEEARRNPVIPTPGVIATSAPILEAPGTPRVHFEITPPPGPVRTQPPNHGIVQVPPPATADAPAGPAEQAATPATPVPTETPLPAPPVNSHVQCQKECRVWANAQAREACEERCAGATPLPGATAAPVIIH